MTRCHVETTAAADLACKLPKLTASGGRMQMAYAVFPDIDGPAVVRYISSVSGKEDFVIWEVATNGMPLPSLASICPLLGWYEREIMELSGLAFTNHPEPERLVTAPYPLLSPPLDPRPDVLRENRATLASTRLPQVSGKHVQLLPFGPVRADVLESAQFIFYYIGEGILHYHPNLFLKHRGMEKQFESGDPHLSSLIAERISGVDSVAHAIGYAAAIEDASDCVPPMRAQWLRVIAAELERVYNHLHYLGHLCHTTTLKVGEAQGKLLEEQAKQINARATGSRLLRNIVCPGGVRRDINLAAVRDGLPSLAEAFERYAGLLLRTTSHLDRLISTAPLSQQLAFDQGATGPIERASGLDRDLRRDHPYAAYDRLTTNVARRDEGDAFARMKVRIDEIRASFALIREAVRRTPPDGLLCAPCVPPPGACGLGWVEGARGTLLYAVHIDADGQLGRVKVKSPSFSNWSVFPFTVHDSNMMDYAINEASFGLTIAGCAR